MMKELFGEFLGTLILILLGNGVVAGVVLPKTKSNNAGWIVITMGNCCSRCGFCIWHAQPSPPKSSCNVCDGLKRNALLGFRFPIHPSSVRRGYAGSDFGLVAIQTAL